MDGVGIFEPVEAPDDRASGIGPRGGRTIELAFKPGCQAVVGCAVGTRQTDRRHLTSAKLPNDFLPDFAVLPDARDAHLIQRQASRLQFLVVTGDAVSL